MTELEYYRLKRLMPQLRRLSQQYPMRSLDNIIRQVDDRLSHHKTKKQK